MQKLEKTSRKWVSNPYHFRESFKAEVRKHKSKFEGWIWVLITSVLDLCILPLKAVKTFKRKGVGHNAQFRMIKRDSKSILWIVRIQ